MILDKALKLNYNVPRKEYIVYIDFSRPSKEKRLFLIDTNKKIILESHHVSHGVGSADPRDKGMAVSFSNVPNSKKSSLGAMVTGKIYYGKHGKSLKLHGLEKGINDNVYKRHIVIHPASYVTDSYIRRNGRAGCSWGCPAIDPAISSKFIDKIKEGCLVYIGNK